MLKGVFFGMHILNAMRLQMHRMILLANAYKMARR